MLYLNMLYDMVAYSIKKQFKTIVFARTALEIKSSVGAKPVAMKGFIKSFGGDVTARARARSRAFLTAWTKKESTTRRAGRTEGRTPG